MELRTDLWQPQTHPVLKADSIDEPKTDVTVPMLEAMSPDEAAFYAAEANVAEPDGKSEVLFRELEEQYGFIGGSTSEYAKYFLRPDMPAQMWHFGLADEVKAIAGFSVVAKKSGAQRKFLMC